MRSLGDKRWPPIPIIENLSGVTESKRLERVRALFASMDSHSYSNKTNNRKTTQPKWCLVRLRGDVRHSVSDCLLQGGGLFSLVIPPRGHEQDDKEVEEEETVRDWVLIITVVG